MERKFLLYIDILGFSELVRNDIYRVRRLYHLIDQLNVHHHDAFRFIIFSDTILIYNINEPLRDADRQYYVMFLIEFAQNLLYECAGKNYYFRSVLVYGEFEHKSYGNVDRIFGKALVDAYLKEKAINCMGLFIDGHCQKFNVVFPVEPYNRYLSFVYLNQSLDRFANGELGEWPVDPELMYQTDSEWYLAKDVYFLKDIYKLMRNHQDPRVREKMLNTWDYYYRRYTKLLQDLESENFNLAVLSEGFNWGPAKRKVFEGYRGFGIDPPSKEEFKKIIEEARIQGRDAAKKKIKEIYGESNPGERFYAPCGGGLMVLDIDARSILGKFLLKEAENEDVSTWNKRGEGLIINIRGMHNNQERSVDVAAAEAAMAVLRKQLGVDGYIEEYYD